MSIRFRCRNLAGFDPQSNSYRKCGQILKVSDDMAGTVVNCPKCSQPTQVPEITTEKRSVPESPTPGLGVVHRASKNIMEMDFGTIETSTIPGSIGEGVKRCTQCGGRYDEEGTCRKCGFVDPVRRADRERVKNRRAKSAGFQLWFAQISSDPEKAILIGWSIFLLSLLFLCLIAVGGILSGRFIGIAFAVGAAFALVFDIALFRATRRVAKDPAAPLGILRPIWMLILTAARFFKWKGYDSRLAKRTVIDRRQNPVNDETIRTIEGLSKCNVLDLSGSDISDRGLEALYGNHSLQCLVLCHTSVSPEGVGKLQQAIPRLWIWH